MQPLPVMSLTWVLIIGPFMDALMLPPPTKPTTWTALNVADKANEPVSVQHKQNLTSNRPLTSVRGKGKIFVHCYVSGDIAKMR